MSYSDTNNSNSTMSSAASAAGGFFEGSALANKTFYGFHLNDQGDCTIDVINDGTTVVKLPDQDTEILDPDAYKHWFWSSDHIEFEFDNTNGHLIMKML